MRRLHACTGRFVFSLFAAFTVVSAVPANAEVQSGQVQIKAVKGIATYSTREGWQPMAAPTTFTPGATITPGPDATVDLVLQYNGTVLRLIPNSTLSFDKLNKEAAGEDVITETSLHLIEGAIIGSQRKLAAPSHFEVNVPGGVATIKGT